MMGVPIIIDIEASGFGKGSYPIEVGYVTAEGQVWCSLIKPEPGWQHWDISAEDIHGITQDILESHGNTVQYVALHLNLHLQDCDVYSDAWLHDYVWLAKLFDAADILPGFKLKDLREILLPEQYARWDSTKLSVEQELQLNRHRASSDACVLQLTWLRSLQAHHTLLHFIEP